jgi:hypothetical protein
MADSHIDKSYTKKENNNMISELLDELYDELDTLKINPQEQGIQDDEDMIAFALRFLKSNIDNAFDADIKEEGE